MPPVVMTAPAFSATNSTSKGEGSSRRFSSFTRVVAEYTSNGPKIEDLDVLEQNDTNTFAFHLNLTALSLTDHHHPSNFHHASPNVPQIVRVTSETTNPTDHHSRCVT